jgi:hypothetical protein
MDRSNRLAGDMRVYERVAAGAIETVRLLMAAAVDPALDWQWKSNTMLGLRFQDHLGGRLGTVTPFSTKRLFKTFSTLYWKGYKFQPKLVWNLTPSRRSHWQPGSPRSSDGTSPIFHV